MTDEGVKIGMDIAAGSVIVGSLANLLPSIAALLSIIWFAIRIWESETVQGIVTKIRNRKKGARD